MSRRCAVRAVLAAMLVLASASACTGGPPPARVAGTGTGAASRATTAGTASASAPVPDWRRIPTAPLGTTLAALYSGLHEILYFQAAQQAADSPDAGEGAAADCYRSNGPSPRVLNHGSDDYVLCFEHDRLARVEAVLRLPTDEARELTQRLCDAWLRDGISGTRSEDSCAARAGDAAFRLRWAAVDGDTGTALTITVYTPGGRE